MMKRINASVVLVGLLNFYLLRAEKSEEIQVAGAGFIGKKIIEGAALYIGARLAQEAEKSVQQESSSKKSESSSKGSDENSSSQKSGSSTNESEERINFCLKKGSLISTPAGEIPIEELEVGDFVWSFDIDHQNLRMQKIQSVIVGTQSHYLNVELSSGRVISMTDGHPIYLPEENRYVKLEALLIREDIFELKVLIQQEGILVEGSIVNIHLIEVDVEVYNLDVLDLDEDDQDEQNYFAEGLLVHNKD